MSVDKSVLAKALDNVHALHNLKVAEFAALEIRIQEFREEHDRCGHLLEDLRVRQFAGEEVSLEIAQTSHRANSAIETADALWKKRTPLMNEIGVARGNVQFVENQAKKRPA